MTDPEVPTAAGSDAAVVAELARQAVGTSEPVKLTDLAEGDVEVRAWVLHNTQQVHLEALEQYQHTPTRTRGQAKTSEPDAFVAYVRRLATAATTIWVDQASFTAPPIVTAVLNDHTEAIAPGWRDHRITLALRATPLWSHWVGRDGKLTGQLDFAEHVEDGLAAVVSPDAATLLEIAQTFDAARKVQFRSATRIANGEIQMRWDEDTQATAGRTGQVEIPDRIVLSLQPWPGSVAYEVAARLRYRLREGQLTLGYRLDRVDEVIRHAVSDLRDHLATELPDYPVLAGQAPEPLAPHGAPF